MRIAIVANTAWYIYNFRINLMRELRAKGHEVIAFAPGDEFVEEFCSEGFELITWSVAPSGMNPFRELTSVIGLSFIIKKHRPNVLLTYTPKGNIYGAFAAKITGTNVINNISGLGRVFVEKSSLTYLVRNLYKLALRKSIKVFFQNDDDLNLFLTHRIVKAGSSERLPGSGVDLTKFVAGEELKTKVKDDGLIFLLIARLLWEKGIGEFVEAARRIKKVYPKCRFQVLGFLGMENPAAVPAEMVQRWVDEGVIEYLGEVRNVLPIIRDADCVVLPSYYREGVPRSLLEAASVGKPLISTDSPGCRDAIEDGVTGFLVRPKDIDDLAAKLEMFIKLEFAEKIEMGAAGRKKMEREFDEKIVITRYLDIIESIAVNLS